jgi:hypothetical protein
MSNTPVDITVGTIFSDESLLSSVCRDVDRTA